MSSNLEWKQTEPSIWECGNLMIGYDRLGDEHVYSLWDGNTYINHFSTLKAAQKWFKTYKENEA